MTSGMDISVGGLYFIVINLLTFLLYGLDKYKRFARNGGFRNEPYCSWHLWEELLERFPR